MKDPTAQSLTFAQQDNLFDAVALSWLTLAFFASDGFMGKVMFGSQTRLMDGVLGRANCLLITTLWNAFKFVMVPLSVQLAAHYPPAQLVAVITFLWGSYPAVASVPELVGSLFGHQTLHVWGLGDVNRKSLEGTAAAFIGSMAVCLSVVFLQHLPSSWIALAIV